MIDHVYKYRNAFGSIVHETVRYKDPKDFKQRRPVGNGKYAWNLKDVETVLYDLPRLATSAKGQTIYIVEGEKDADGLNALGLICTTNPMGAGKWKEHFSDCLKDCNPAMVVILPDHDDVGAKHAQAVAASLHAKALDVRIVELPGLLEHGDASDYLAAGGTIVGIAELAEKVTPWSPPAVESATPVVLSGDDEDYGEDPTDPVGDVGELAFHGPLGMLALKTQPETEANALFVLLHLMVYFGVSAGRGPHIVIGADRHYPILYGGLIGPTGIGRKTTAGSVATEIWTRVDPQFVEDNIAGGLNSGAGLLYRLRDPAEVKNGKNGSSDEGVSDKRRVFLEPELSSVLMQGHRESDPLLCHLRNFYDCQRVVRSDTKDPQKVTGGIIGILGQCTPADLEIHLNDVDKQNGTANRFLFLFGVRSKIMPSRGNVFDLLDNWLGEDLDRLRRAVDFAKTVGEMNLDAKAEAQWEPIYRAFCSPPPGPIGAFFVRAPTIVLRMAAIFTLGDLKKSIECRHLDAALAIWHHSERSLRWIFRSDADPRADKLMAALKAAKDGLTKREIIHDVFSKHLDAATIDDVLMRLLANRSIAAIKMPSEGGRPATRYVPHLW